MIRHSGVVGRLLQLGCFLLLIGLCACASIKRPLPQAAEVLPPPSAEPLPYLIQPGDILESHYVVDSTLDQQALVTPDGRVSFRYASDVPAIGLTLPQLRDRIVRQSSIVDRGFAITLRSSVGTRVYVTGEVTTPGEILINGDITALQAISRAGGFKLGAQKSQIVLLRRDKANKAAFYGVNLDDASNGVSPEDDIQLRTFDVLYVPRDRAGNLSEVFERVRQAVPFNFSAVYGNSAVGFLN